MSMLDDKMGQYMCRKYPLLESYAYVITESYAYIIRLSRVQEMCFFDRF